MRVITGLARGRRLETLEGIDVRPTTDRVKEAIFSVIQFETEGRTFLDLFAGSGQMGIEALSRGAKQSFFVDNSKNSINTIKNNLKATNLELNAKIFAMDYNSFLSINSEKIDVAFLDPPYRTGVLQKALQILPEHMNETGLIVVENPLDEQILSQYGKFTIDREYRYGKIKISVYRCKDM